MAIRTNNFQPVRYGKDRHQFSAKLAVTAKRGMIVSRKNGATDEVELATNKAGYFLTRDVTDAAGHKAWHEADMLRPGKGGWQSPFIAGGAVQCEDLEEVWVEGDDLLHASMDAATPVGCPVTSDAGKFKECSNITTMEIMGTVVINEAAKNGAGRRFLIRIERAPKAANAA